MPPSSAYTPGIRSLLPLLYVAWADRVLSPSEVRLLEKKASELTFLTAAEKELLRRWTNPRTPPSRELFQHWRILLHDQTEALSSDSRKSLVDLGLEMARHSDSGAEPSWSKPDTRLALEELEEALGMVSIETYRSLFPQDQPEPAEGPFSAAALTQILDGRYADTRQHMRILLSDPAFAYGPPQQKEDHRRQVLHWCRLLAKQGLGALSYPELYGGRSDMGAYATAFESLGYHDLSLAVKFGVQFGLFGGSILWLGTKRHHDLYLAEAGSLQLPGCFAMTETGHGSNVRGLETTATFDPVEDEFIVHSPTEQAGKEYIGNALHGRLATVFAQLIVGGENHGVHALLVPLRDEHHRLLPGIRIEDNGQKVGLNGVDNGRIWFDQVRVPRENLLNRFGEVSAEGVYSSPIENPGRRFFTMLGTLVGGRVCVPKAGLSAAKSGLTIAVRYALRRRQFAADFTQPETLLLDYPSHQRRLMPLLAKAYALHFALDHLTDRYVSRSDDDIREIESLAAGLKSYATWFTTECLQECREACGGKGYLSENRIGGLKADTDIFTTFEGDNTVLMQLVAKSLLTTFRQSFHEEGTMGVLRFLATRITTAVTERNPIVVRNTDPEHLLDPDFHHSAFTYREQRLLYSVAQRLRNRIKSGENSYDAYLACQMHLLALAEAHVERIVLEQFRNRIENLEASEAKAALEKVYALFALATIERRRAWYLEANYLEGNKTKAIRRLIDQLCLEVRQQAGLLVDAFAIPPSLLAAPIAL